MRELFTSKQLIIVGTNHKHSSVSIREKLSCANGSMHARLRAVINTCNGTSEAVILSTCNRTEVYVISTVDTDAATQVTSLMSKWSSIPTEELNEQVYTFRDNEAVKHLFAVAAGLDSLVLGEQQIQEQVKLAAREAAEIGTTGRILPELFQRAYKTATRVRKETGLGLDGGSISSAAVTLLNTISQKDPIQTILLIGAGKMMNLAATDLSSLVDQIWVTNRTAERAAVLAERLNGKLLPFDQVRNSLHQFDAILCFTSSRDHLITATDLKMAVEKCKNRRLILIDASVPRNFDPESAKIPGIQLYNIDDLATHVTDHVVSQNRILKAGSLIEKEVEDFEAHARIYNVNDTLKNLRKMAEEIRANELSKALLRMHNASERDKEIMDLLTRRIINKLLHEPTARLKEHASNGDGEFYEAIIRELFAMGQQKQ
ncbi:MAG: glutamyl-tRNA reductase [Candidatus Bathyarchaeia archaeon]